MVHEVLDVKTDVSRTACLLVHGFGGNTDEVRPLAEYLANLGYKVECPQLKGHTGKRRDLKNCSYKDWISSARVSFNRLRAEYDRVIIVGFSMGGLIAFQIALTEKVDVIITLNTPIYYWDIKRIALNVIDDIRCWKSNNIRRYLRSVIRFPLNAMINFRLFLTKSKKGLSGINCPVFVAQAISDDTVRWKSANFIYENISSKVKKRKFYDDSGHCILWSNEADNVIRDVSDFINQI